MVQPLWLLPLEMAYELENINFLPFLSLEVEQDIVMHYPESDQVSLASPTDLPPSRGFPA